MVSKAIEKAQVGLFAKISASFQRHQLKEGKRRRKLRTASLVALTRKIAVHAMGLKGW